MDFEWDPKKAACNLVQHGVGFELARRAFADPHRVIEIDETHSQTEPRFFCYGQVDDRVLTVRFTPRQGTIRIIGAAYWRRGKKRYEQQT